MSEQLKTMFQDVKTSVASNGEITAYVPFTQKTKESIKTTLTNAEFTVTGEHTNLDKTEAFIVKIDLEARVRTLETRLNELITKLGIKE